MNDVESENSLSDCEAVSWKCFKKIVKSLLGNHKANNYKQLITERLKNNEGCNPSLKIQFLDSHMNFSPPILEVTNMENAFTTMDIFYQGKWNPRMLAE